MKNTRYATYCDLEKAVLDDDLDFTDKEDLKDYGRELISHMSKSKNITTLLTLMRRHKQDDRLKLLKKQYPKEYEASAANIWCIDKVTRNHLMANELLFLNIDPQAHKLLPVCYYQIQDKDSKAYLEIRPLFKVSDDVLLTSFFLMPLNDQLSAIEQAERETLTPKIIELITTLAHNQSWPVNAQFRHPVSWHRPGDEPSANLSNAIFGMDTAGKSTYKKGHIISSYINVVNNTIDGLKNTPPLKEVMKIAETLCEFYAIALKRPKVKPSPEEQLELQAEADAEQEAMSAAARGTKDSPSSASGQ